MTWWSWTRRPSRATRSRRIRSPAAAWSSSTAGGCSTRSWTAVPRPSGRSRSTPLGESVSRHDQAQGRGRPARRAPAVRAGHDPRGRPPQQAGADVRLGVTVTGVRRDDRGRVVGVYGHDRAGAPVDIAARFVIGADGLRSRVARSVGAAIIEDRPAGGATQYAYYAGIPWPGIELFVADRAFAGVFPTHDGQACVWVCTPSADARAARRRTGSREEAFGELAAACRPAAGRAAAPRSPDLAGAGHAAHAQPGAPGLRPGLGAGRRRRLSP